MCKQFLLHGSFDHNSIRIYSKESLFCFISNSSSGRSHVCSLFTNRGWLVTHLIILPHMLALFMIMMSLIQFGTFLQLIQTSGHISITFKHKFLTNRMRNQAPTKNVAYICSIPFLLIGCIMLLQVSYPLNSSTL